MRDVLKLLATGTDDSLLKFELVTAAFANFFEQRGQTVYFALGGEHLEYILDRCLDHDVTLQRIDGAGDHESYRTLFQGTMPGWSPAPRLKPAPASMIDATGTGPTD